MRKQFRCLPLAEKAFRAAVLRFELARRRIFLQMLTHPFLCQKQRLGNRPKTPVVVAQQNCFDTVFDPTIALTLMLMQKLATNLS